jgi:hypothetical protein
MYELKTTGNDTYEISKEELDKIKEIINNGNNLIELKSGELINTSCIISISKPKLEPYFMGNPMNQNKTKVYIQGEWRAFDQKYKGKIKMLPKNNNTTAINIKK